MCEVDNQGTAKKSLRSEENKKIFKEDISRRNLHLYQGMLVVSLLINVVYNVLFKINISRIIRFINN